LFKGRDERLEVDQTFIPGSRETSRHTRVQVALMLVNVNLGDIE
jgi:hypothetical protein